MPGPETDSAAFRVREWMDGRTTVLDPDDVREVYVAGERAGRDLDNARGELLAVHAEKHRYQTERDQARTEVDRLHEENALLRVDVANAAPDHEALADDAIAAHEENERLQDLLGLIWLYVSWRWVTKQLTTEQKELWADAVDAHVRKGQIEDGEDSHPVAERWWRDDFVEGRDG